MDTAVVLTGIDGVETILAARTAERPRYLLGSLTELYRPYPAVTPDGSGFRCGAAVAAVDNGKLKVSGSRQDVDTWRAACAAWWDAHPHQASAAVPDLSD
jgi:hypothetical protein